MTIEKARAVYGVVVKALDPEVHDYRIDQEGTNKLRNSMSGRHLTEGYGPGEVHPDGKHTGELLLAARGAPAS